MRKAVFGIPLDRQMREECKILENVPHAAPGHGSIHTGRCVEQDAIARGDSSGVGSGQAGDAIEQRGFP